MITGHGGNVTALAHRLGCSIDEIIDMSCNLNPLGPPEGLEAFLAENISEIRSLPPADAGPMVRAFSRYYDVDPDRVIAGNGTTWFIYTLPNALKTQRMLIVGPTYSDYKDACQIQGAAVSFCMATRDTGFVPDLDRVSDLLDDPRNGFDTVVLCNPNNPTGSLVHRSALLGLISGHKEVFFIIDESYLPFAAGANEISLAGVCFPNLIVLSSMSKIFRMPGLRTGFVCADPSIVLRLMACYQPWSVNALAQTAVTHIFENSHWVEPFIQRTQLFVQREKQVFMEKMETIAGIRVFPSKTYFVLAELTNAMGSDEFCRAISREKILIRDCSNFYGLSDRFVRFSLKTREVNMKLADLVRHTLTAVHPS